MGSGVSGWLGWILMSLVLCAACDESSSSTDAIPKVVDGGRLDGTRAIEIEPAVIAPLATVICGRCGVQG